MRVDECKEIVGSSFEKFFQPIELNVFHGEGNLKSLYVRYLVKKCLLDYFDSINYHDISILNDKKGKPEIYINGELKETMNKMGIKKILCSVSHSKQWLATMIVID